jgi:uncharacterized protein (UPF0261 family)
LCVPDELRVQARTTKEELREIAIVISKKLNKAKGPVKFLIPRRGWSNLSAKGCPLYEPESDKVFNEEIRKHLRPEVEVKEFDIELDSADFALTCVEALLDMMKDNSNQS